MSKILVKTTEGIKVMVGQGGPVGPAGPGVPIGGSSGQILRKNGAGDTDTAWSSTAPDTDSVAGVAAATVISRIGAVETGQGSNVYGYATKALMDADLTPADKSIAYVTNDTTPTNNGTWRKSGASGGGSWVQSSFDRVAVVEAAVAAIPPSALVVEELRTMDDLSEFTADFTLDTGGNPYAKTGSKLSPFYAVAPGVSRLRIVLKSDYIGVVGYNKSYVKVATLSTTSESGLQLVVPSTVYYIRFGYKVANESACLVNIETVETDIKKEVNAELSLSGVNHFYQGDSVKLGANNNGGTPNISYYVGTGEVAVVEGDVVYFILPNLTYSDVLSGYTPIPIVGLDSSHNIIRIFEVTASNYRKGMLGSLVIDDPLITYVVATAYTAVAFVGSSDGYFLFIERELNEAATNFIEAIKEKGRSIVLSEESREVIHSVSGTGVTVVDDVVTLAGATGYIYMVGWEAPIDPLPASIAFKICYRCDIELVSGGPVVLQDYQVPGSRGRKWHLDTVGDSLNIFGSSDIFGTASLYVTSGPCELRISNIQKVFINSDFLTVMTTKTVQDAFFLAEGQDVAAVSLSTLGIASRATKRRIVFFGDSITEGTSGGFVELVAQRFAAPVTNLALSGSYPAKKTSDTETAWNLRDANLANIPEDAGVVVLAGGVNYGAAPLGASVDSVDRTEAYGCLNYAINYIEANHPYARIVLVTPPPARAGDGFTANPVSTWITAFADVAANRGVVLADVAADAGLNSNTLSFCYYDANHPLMEGNYRIAAVIVDAIRKVIY